MIYLLQDCYLDDNNEYQKILKIGYSDKLFKESRENSYNTHNYGYKFLGEKEGSEELESFFHFRFDSLRLGGEWFRYDQEIISKFWEIKENDISSFPSQEDLNEYIRFYILRNLILSFEYLRETYLEKILGEIEEKSKSSEFDFQEFRSIYQKEILRTFKLVVDSEKNFWETLDFSSDNIISHLQDCSLTLPQIAGRQRDTDNPFKNEIALFYKTTRGENLRSREDFNMTQNERKDSTKRLLSLYEKADSNEKLEYLRKLKRDIEGSRYSTDFVSISKKTGLPVYNPFIELAYERAWEVEQVDYQNQISVTRALEDQGFGVETYRTSDEQELQDFLDNRFYATGFFHEKMRMYCEFRDTHKDSPDVLVSLDHKIPDQRFKMYYEYYGTQGCSARKYREADLYRGWKDVTKESQMLAKVCMTWGPGDRVIPGEVKSILQGYREELGISGKAKATDLGEYFEMTKTKITLPDKTVVRGFKLGPKN